jgi:hypothetical protein
MKVKKMLIRVLERLFPKTMRNYWYSGRNSGFRYGLDTIQTLIYSELKELNKRDDPFARHRASELQYLLSKIKGRY